MGEPTPATALPTAAAAAAYALLKQEPQGLPDAERRTAEQASGQGRGLTEKTRRTCLNLVLVFVAWLGVVALICLVALLFPAPETCAVETHSVTPLQSPYPLHLGTAANIGGGGWPMSDIDLEGLWWLRWDPAGSWIIRLYNNMRLEIAVTFAGSQLVVGGAVVNTTDPDGDGNVNYPITMLLYGQQARHWGYSNGFFSWANQMLSHRLLWPVDFPLTLNYANSSSGNIVSLGEFQKLNADEWMRRVSGATYTFTRIVYGNGTVHPTWGGAFESFMAGYQLRIWGNDDTCGRLCEILMMIGGTPSWAACKWCASLCGRGGYAA